jgi:hypothetical protein
MNDELKYKSYEDMMNSFNKRSQEISEIILKMTDIGIANMANSKFVAIMKNHEELHNLMIKVITDYQNFLETKQ